MFILLFCNQIHHISKISNHNDRRENRTRHPENENLMSYPLDYATKNIVPNANRTLTLSTIKRKDNIERR